MSLLGVTAGGATGFHNGVVMQQLRRWPSTWFRLPATEARIAWPDVVLALLATAAVQFWVVQRADYWAHGPRWLVVLVAWTPLFIAIRRLDPALALAGLMVGAYGMSLLAASVAWPMLIGALLAVWYLPNRWGTGTGLILTVLVAGLPVLVDLDRGAFVYRVYPDVFRHYQDDYGGGTLRGITQSSWDRVAAHHWAWWISALVVLAAAAALLVRRRRGVVPVRRSAGQWTEDLQAAARPRTEVWPVQVLLAVALTSPVLIELWWDQEKNGNWWTAPGWMPWAIAFAPLTLVVRRRWPVVPVAVLGIASLISYWQTNEVWTLLFALAIALFSLGTAPRSLAWSIPGAVLVLAALPTIAELIRYPQLILIFPKVGHQDFFWDSDTQRTRNSIYEEMVDRQWPLTWSLILLVPLCAGIAVRLYRRNRESARREAELERVAVEREAEQVVLTERSFIARDLHDVVAHAVNLMVIQAETGPDLIRRGEADVLAGFQRIGDAGRRALSELDRLLSALRDEEGIPDPQLAPQPGLGDLSQLVTDVSDGHLPIALDVTGDPDGPPEGQQLAAYRLVQEALTNVVRHAKASAAQVLVQIEETGVRVEVTDDGSGFDLAVAAHGGRHGLAGMRERVRIEGGTLDIRSTPGAGTTVAAWFPVGGNR
ncbi:signal transduction histidine kinase [Kribbella rubisoli]|uniref:histidine kinase n=2 Tax=Kribbella rubisoli TaxID=3075929 RepID=A0A4Q7XAP7_9ACTN|nr:signal transduction histidine kinase [Kribbella rubisoli]